jgi:L-fuconolactonase
VIDHGAKPRSARTASPNGMRDRAAGALPNVSCKLSGLLTERGDRPPEAVAPYVAALLELFGPARLMWGSDWPVLEAAGSWGGWLDLALALVPEAAQADVFEKTAARFYGLAVEALQ